MLNNYLICDELFNKYLNFDELIPEILSCGCPTDWWTVDLCFWPDAWDVTADSIRFLNVLRDKYAV